MTAAAVQPPRVGALSVDGRNTFELLRESLYSEPDIVFRELVSNGLDAVAKRVDREAGDRAAIEVRLDPERGVLTISDRGIGMSAEDVDRYINQVALSGTAEYVHGLETDAPRTIGHFGVGFYSAFMIADVVELQTRDASGAPAVHWRCTTGMDWEMDAGERTEPGTTVILHLGADSRYVADPSLVKSALKRYFAFPAVSIDWAVGADDPSPIGDPDPLWRHPGELDREALNAFYREYFAESDDPLGWVRVESADLGLRGMVFLRNTHGGAEAIDGRVDIYSRGVYVDSDVKQLVPRFVNLQHAIIECDELPLVVSRNQVRSGDPQDVPGLVFECLSQEMAIAMHELFTDRRARYEELWPELSAFVKYGVMTDRVFGSVMTRKVLFATTTGELVTLAEYLERMQGIRPGTVFYSSDPLGQAAYVDAFRRAGVPALVLDHVIDQPLMQRLEAVANDAVFVRLDADITGVLAEDTDPADVGLGGRVVERFRSAVGERLPDVEFRAVGLRVPDLPVALNADEGSRRMNDLAQLSGLAQGRIGELPPVTQHLLLNLRNPTVRLIGDLPDALARLAAEQLVDLVLLGQDALEPDDLLAFQARSQRILADFVAFQERESK